MVRDDTLRLVLDLQSRLRVALVIGLWVPDSEDRVVVLGWVSIKACRPPAREIRTSVMEIAEFLSTMFPSCIAFKSLFLCSSATFDVPSATFLSISPFLAKSSEASPLFFLICPISLIKTLTSLRRLSWS